MIASSETPIDSPAPFATLRAVIKHRALVVRGGTAFVALLGIWLGFRTGIADFYVIGFLLAAVAHLALQAAIDVLQLVSETLMPR